MRPTACREPHDALRVCRARGAPDIACWLPRAGALGQAACLSFAGLTAGCWRAQAACRLLHLVGARWP
eukprot:8944739-Alexandrium_andersonii.AAC.1